MTFGGGPNTGVTLMGAHTDRGDTIQIWIESELYRVFFKVFSMFSTYGGSRVRVGGPRPGPGAEAWRSVALCGSPAGGAGSDPRPLAPRGPGPATAWQSVASSPLPPSGAPGVALSPSRCEPFLRPSRSRSRPPLPPLPCEAVVLEGRRPHSR